MAEEINRHLEEAESGDIMYGSEGLNGGETILINFKGSNRGSMQGAYLGICESSDVDRHFDFSEDCGMLGLFCA